MNKIKQLSPEEIHKIAAGEVVERPGNVVKELVENSIDAGASSITIYLERGGKSLIRVIDDGCGMSRDDARMSIIHHATSKINTVEDLDKILTFGFRGEALSTISSVSKMSLKTKLENELEGIQLNIEEGKIVSESLVAQTTGTDITISDIFYNVPARRKFLKTDDTEWHVIFQLIQAYALSHLDCAFKLYHNDKLVLQCQKSNSQNQIQNLKERTKIVFDDAISYSIIFAEKNIFPTFSIEGLLTDPQYSRYDRNQIFLFVNKRWIKNFKVAHAFIKGYAGILPKGKYPAGAIYIDIDPKDIDVNIHPRKEEINFLHPRQIENAIESLIHNSLINYTSMQTVSLNNINKNLVHLEAGDASHESLFDQVSKQKHSGQVSLKETLNDQNHFENLTNKENFQQILDSTFLEKDKNLLETQKSSNLSSEKTEPFDFTQKNINNENFIGDEIRDNKNIFIQNLENFENSQYSKELSEKFATEASSQNINLIGQLKNTYILIENEQGLLLIDQHAAHERILYETFVNRFSDIAIIPLLFPIILNLSKIESELLEINQEIFDSYGLSIQECGPNQFAITTSPVLLKNIDLEDLVKKILSEISENSLNDVSENYENNYELTGNDNADNKTNENNKVNKNYKNSMKEKLHHAMRAQMACKAAVKAGDPLTKDKMYEIIFLLNQVENRFTCPHGRPTTYTLSLYDIERKFKRKI